MVNINGKEWSELEPKDIENVVSEQDFEESFFFELKDDRVSNKKFTEEISAFSNTFGGYVFLGISDKKQIEGCTSWNEQKIHTVIHDSITPTPSFDVKKFTINTKVVYVVKINEGGEPPYITSSGKIYERLSSGSFVISDAVRLSQIYNKREQLLTKIEQKIAIPPIAEKTNNIYGYIDIGFSMAASDEQAFFDVFRAIDLKSLAQGLEDRTKSFNLSFIGNSIIYTPGGLSNERGGLPAHINNFLEIMADGSAKMRILLMNNDSSKPIVNMIHARTILGIYKKIYTDVFGHLFPSKIAYVKKYEAITVQSQFQPVSYYDDDVLELHPDWIEDNERFLASLENYRKAVGVDVVITDNRIPKTGLYTIDKRRFELLGLEYNSDTIVDTLFYSQFATLGTAAIADAFESNL